MSYYLAPSLVALRDEIDARFPQRDTSSDGWIGDTSHAARPSDHNPDWGSGGVVRAIDVDVNDRNPDADLRRVLLNATVGDHRVWYVISNGRIYSRTYGWEARRYTGSNPHTAHVHVSIVHTREAERDTSRWLAERKRRVRPIVDLSRLRDAFESNERSRDVARVQRALNAKTGADLNVDGVAGKGTERAWRQWEEHIGVRHANVRPHEESLRRLGRGRFAVRE